MHLGTPKLMTEMLLGLEMSPYLILLMVMALIFLLGWPLGMGAYRIDRCTYSIANSSIFGTSWFEQL